jgi:hypothetical protein
VRGGPSGEEVFVAAGAAGEAHTRMVMQDFGDLRARCRSRLMLGIRAMG